MLYIKTIASRVLGPQGALRVIFTKAQQAAPCLLVFEDIDSIVTNKVRSYSFKEIDGLEDNNGILVIGSTNDRKRGEYNLEQSVSKELKWRNWTLVFPNVLVASTISILSICRTMNSV